MMSFLANLQSYHAGECLLVLAAVLIVVDYFFPTDWPAHFGYVAIAAASFFLSWSSAPGAFWDAVKSGGLAIGIWLALAVLHRLWFHHWLSNAEGVPGPSEAATQVEQATEDEGA